MTPFLSPCGMALQRTRALRRWASAARPTADPVTAAVLEYLNFAFLLDANAFWFGARSVRTTRWRCAASGGDRTVGCRACCRLVSRRAVPVGSIPPPLPPGPCELTDVRHPLLTSAVPNTITLGPPFGVLVTGSNMSGKSTLLPDNRRQRRPGADDQHVPGEQLRGADRSRPQLNGRLDDSIAGKSSHLSTSRWYSTGAASERGVRRICSCSTNSFAERNRGAIAAAEAVLGYLVEGSRQHGHVAIAATHDDELVTLLADDVSVAVHLRDSLDAEGLSFHYTLRPGPATSCNCHRVARFAWAPRGLVARADARARSMRDLKSRPARGVTS